MTIDSHCTELNKNWERKFVPSPRWLTSPYTWQNSKSRKHITTKMKIKSKNTNQNASRPSVHFSEKLPSFAYNKQKKIIKIWNGLRSTHKITTTITYVEEKNTKSICKLSGDLTFLCENTWDTELLNVWELSNFRTKFCEIKFS